MKKLFSGICSLILSFFVMAPVTAAVQHVDTVKLDYGQLSAKSRMIKVDVPTKLTIQLSHSKESAGRILYTLFKMKSDVSINEEGKEEILKWDESVAKGMLLSTEPRRVIEEEVGPGTYNLELSTTVWLPAISTPTCEGEAILLSAI